MTAFEAALAQYRAYEEQLRAHDPDVAAWLAAPHPDPAAAVAEAFPGLVLPPELVAWWSWHDGMTPPVQYAPTLGPRLRFLSVKQALQDWRQKLTIAQGAAEPPDMPAECFWPANRMPVLGEQHAVLTVDLAPSAPRPGVIYQEPEVMAHNAPVVARSLPEVVEWWTRLLAVGATTWQPLPSGSGLWVTDRSRVPADLLGNPAAYIDLEGPRDPRFLPLGDF